jgi:PAS domain S-box-containing protein
MGELIRSKNWDSSAIGSPDQWPESLRTTVSLLLHSQFPMFIWWGKDLTTIYNDSYRVIAGEKHPQLLGKSGRDGWTEIWSDLGPLVENVFSGNSTWSEDLPLNIKRHGFIENTYFTFSYSPVLDDSGAVAGLFCACIETTEKVVARKKLEVSESRFRRMIEHATVAIALTSGREMIFQSINAPMLQLIDRDRDVVGNPLLQVLPELKEQPVLEILYRVHDEREIFRATEEPTKLLLDGKLQLRYHNIAYIPLIQQGGETDILHIAIDVTAQVEARRKVEESEANMRNTILQAPVAMCILRGPSFIVEIANDFMFELWGKQRSDMLHKPIFEGLTEAKNQGFEAMLGSVYKTGETIKAFGVPVTLPRNGKTENVFIDFVYHAYREPDGTISGVIAVATDVTEQVMSRQKIESSEARFRLLADAMPQMIWTGDANGYMHYYNQAVFDYSGLDITELQNGGWADIVHPEEREQSNSMWLHSIQTGEDYIFQHRLRNNSADYRWQLSRAVPQRDTSGNINLWIGTSTDIHEQKLFEADLDRKVKERTATLEILNKELQRSNAQLEEFAHAASHDLKEPIRKIRFFTDRLKAQLKEKLGADDEHIFGRVEQASQRMNALIDDLLLYSHVSQKPHEKEPIDLNEKIKKVLEDLELEIQKKNAVIRIEKLPVVKGYRRQLQQLFQNLLSNALKYSRSEVTPQIECNASIVHGNEAGFPDDLLYHRITVSDNGIGFEQEQAEKIFQMFQRLHGKGQYEGTGVGLSIARKVAENHNGKLTAHSEKGKGATFNVYLPVD